MWSARLLVWQLEAQKSHPLQCKGCGLVRRVLVDETWAATLPGPPGNGLGWSQREKARLSDGGWGHGEEWSLLLGSGDGGTGRTRPVWSGPQTPVLAPDWRGGVVVLPVVVGCEVWPVEDEEEGEREGVWAEEERVLL